MATPIRYRGSNGCACCGGGGGGTPCTGRLCNSCPPLVASDYCFCITRIVYTQVGGDCPSFDHTFDPPLCNRGVCHPHGGLIVVSTAVSSGSFELPDRTVFYSAGGLISCSENTNEGGTTAYYGLGFEFAMAPPLGPFAYPSVSVTYPAAGIADTNVPPAPGGRCDIDSLLGTYETDYFADLFSFDTVRIYASFTKGGTCPPAGGPIGDGVLTEANNFMTTEGGNYLILE